MSDLYFAYGSNLSHAQMKSRCPASTPDQFAVLRGYKLNFPFWVEKRWEGSGAAGIIQAQGSLVEGFLFRMTEDDFTRLDWWEAVHEDKYRRHMITVYTRDDAPIEAQTYIPTCSGEEQFLPSRVYLDTIIGGAQDCGLSQSYIDFLRAIRDD